MPLSFTSFEPHRLVLAEARIGSSENWATIPGVEAVAWRPETSLAYLYEAVNTNSAMLMYKAVSGGRGFGRKLTGVLWTRDAGVAEALVAASHLNATAGAVPTVAADLMLRFKFNTGLNTSNFRYVTKTFQPVVCGYGYGSMDWFTTLRGVDRGMRNLIPLPFRVMVDPCNTHFNTTNTSNPGMYTNFSNT